MGTRESGDSRQARANLKFWGTFLMCDTIWRTNWEADPAMLTLYFGFLSEFDIGTHLAPEPTRDICYCNKFHTINKLCVGRVL